MEPSVHLHFEISDSCNNCCMSLRRCCGEQKVPDEFWVDSSGRLEKFNKKKATETTRRLAHARFVAVVETRIEQMRLDRDRAIRHVQETVDFLEEGPVTRDKVEAVAMALDVLAREMETHVE